MNYAKLYPNTRVEGLEEVLVNLNKKIIQIKDRSEKGLIIAASVILNDTETTSPLTPVDKGNLRSSRFVVSAKGKQPDTIPTGNFKGPRKSQIRQSYQEAVSESRDIARANKDKVFVVLGYGANYAVYVHENIYANFQRAGSGPKWLQAAVARNTDRIVKIVFYNIETII